MFWKTTNLFSIFRLKTSNKLLLTITITLTILPPFVPQSNLYLINS